MNSGPERLSGRDIVAILVVAALVLFWAVVGARGDDVECPPRGITTDAEVIKVVDGDTIDCRLTFDFRLRLIDCWAPESRTLDLQEKQRGLAAKAHMVDLVAGRRVRVHVPGNGSLADLLTLSRVLGRVWRLQGDTPDSRDVSTLMVEAGHATTTKDGGE